MEGGGNAAARLLLLEEQGKSLDGELSEVAEDRGAARFDAAGSDLKGEAVDKAVDGTGGAEVLGELCGERRKAGFACPAT